MEDLVGRGQLFSHKAKENVRQITNNTLIVIRGHGKETKRNTLTKEASSMKCFLDDLTWQRFSLGHMWTFLGDRFLMGIIKPEISQELKKVKFRAFRIVWVTISSR